MDYDVVVVVPEENSFDGRDFIRQSYRIELHTILQSGLIGLVLAAVAIISSC